MLATLFQLIDPVLPDSGDAFLNVGPRPRRPRQQLGGDIEPARALRIRDFQLAALRQPHRSFVAIKFDQSFRERFFRELRRITDIDDRCYAALVIEQDGCDVLAFDLWVDPFCSRRDGEYITEDICQRLGRRRS